MEAFKPGPLSAPQARLLNELAEQVRRLRQITAQGPASITHVAGAPVVIEQPDQLPLVEVLSSTGDPPEHVAKRKTRTVANAVVDYEPELRYDRILNPAGTAFPVGTLLEIEAIPDHPGYRWGYPVGAPPAECVGCGWIAGLKDEAEFECLVATVLDPLGQCGCVPTDGIEYFLETTDGTTWTASSPFEDCCGTTGVLTFVRDKDGDGGGRHRLFIPSGSSVCSGTLSGDYFLAPDCCTETAIFFKGGTQRLCDDARTGHPNANTFTVKLEVSACCQNSNYSTPNKWYCVDNVCTLLPRDPGSCVTITGGPWDTEAECEAECEGGGDPVDNDCCADVPRTLAGTFTGSCAGLGGQTLLYNSGGGVWARSGGNVICDDSSPTWDLQLYCEETTPGSGVWVWKITHPSGSGEITADSADCDPFEVVFTIPAGSWCCSGGTFTVTAPP